MKHILLVGVFALLGACSAGATHERPSMGFDLDIALSAKAAERLRATKEGITVSASYYGDAKKDAETHADEVGHIDLGREEIKLPGQAGKAHLSGKTVDLARLGWIDGTAKVNVNVFSSRLANQDNILACDFVDADVARVVKAQPIALLCTLIEERATTEHKP